MCIHFNYNDRNKIFLFTSLSFYVSFSQLNLSFYLVPTFDYLLFWYSLKAVLIGKFHLNYRFFFQTHLVDYSHILVKTLLLKFSHQLNSNREFISDISTCWTETGWHAMTATKHNKTLTFWTKNSSLIICAIRIYIQQKPGCAFATVITRWLLKCMVVYSECDSCPFFVA